MQEGHGETLRYPFQGETALEPPAEWRRLRQGCPTASVTLPSGDDAVLVTRHEDVKSVLSDSRFTRPVRNDNAARMADSDSGGVFNSEMAESIPQAGDAYRQWRRMVGKWFTAKRMAALRPDMEVMADKLIDAMLENGPPADLKAGLAFPLPV